MQISCNLDRENITAYYQQQWLSNVYWRFDLTLNLMFGLKLDNMIRFQSVDVLMATSSAMDEALNIHPQPKSTI